MIASLPIDYPQTITLAFVALIWLVCLAQSISYRKLRRLIVKQKNRSIQTNNLPSVSIVIPTHNQSQELQNLLPLLLEQQYPNDFEIIVADMHSDDETMSMLEKMEEEYSNLHHTICPSTAKDISMDRLALTLGIRAANSEWLVFTQADCTPPSPFWLTHLTQACQSDADAVLGMSALKNPSGYSAKKCQFFQLWQQMKYLPHAVTHTPYRVDNSCLCYRKSLFLKNQGFASSYDLTVGAENILVNHNIVPKRCKVNVHPEAIMYRECTPEYLWEQEQTLFMETRQHLRHTWAYKMKYAMDVLSNLIFQLAVIASIVAFSLLPQQKIWTNIPLITWHLIPILVSMWLILTVTRQCIFHRTTSQLGISSLTFSMPFFINLIPLWDICAWLKWRVTNKKTFRKKFLTLLLLVCSSPTAGLATSNDSTLWQQLATSEHRIAASDVNTLFVEIDNLNFFRDNEYSSTLTKGYSLPGLWIQPRLTYAPIQQIGLELGFHAMIFNGANKYPNYVYHDIGTWKGNQYQSGAHVLPWVRAKAQFKYLTVVLGNIYGGQNHGLIDPLFNTETNLSQDPEMGFQLLWNRRSVKMDTWLNWQSYIFQEDSHQEAFTVGSTWQFRLSPESSPFQWTIPTQIVIQHRGGEQDTTHLGVQTICNGSVGLAVRHNLTERKLTHWRTEAHVLGTWQQSGNLWPFDTGIAFNAAAEVGLWKNLHLKGGYFYAPKHFVSLYGNHFFSTLSVRDGKSWGGNQTAYVRSDYHRTFYKNYTLGAEVEAYQTWLPAHQEFNFSFGLYLRINPRILLKRWNK